MRTHHQVIDLNKDGVVSWDDFEVLIARFTELGHLSPKEISKFTDALRVRFISTNHIEKIHLIEVQ